jgi:multiple sugar transport system substrate-binding protein
MKTTSKLSRREFLSLAGISFGAAMMAGCRAPATQAPQPTAGAETEDIAAPQPVALTWWEYPFWVGVTGQETAGLSQDDPKLAEYTTADWPNWAAEQFAQEYPGFSCKVEMLTWDEGRNKLTVAANTGTGRPHLFLEDGPVILKFVRTGAMLPVALSAEDEQDYYPAGLAAASYDGELWYRPWLAGARMLVLNRAIFRERGVEDLIPTEGDRLWTYEEFLEAAKATTFTRDNGEEVFGFTSDFAQFAAHFWIDPFIWGYGASIFDETGLKVVIDSPEAEKGMQFVADMQNVHNVMPPGSAGLEKADLVNMFYQGRLAMRQESHSFFGKTEKAKADGTIPNPDMVDVHPVMFPADLPDHNPGTFTVFMGFGQFDTGTDEEKAACTKFIEFLTNEENCRAVAAAGALPVRESGKDMYGDDEYMLYATQAMAYGHADTLSPYYDALNQFLNPMWQAVVSGERTPKEALAEAQELSSAFIAEEEAKKAES